MSIIICRQCGDDVIITGPGPFTGGSVDSRDLAPAIHAGTRKEAGEDGHAVAPIDSAILQEKEAA